MGLRRASQQSTDEVQTGALAMPSKSQAVQAEEEVAVPGTEVTCPWQWRKSPADTRRRLRDGCWHWHGNQPPGWVGPGHSTGLWRGQHAKASLPCLTLVLLLEIKT